MFTGIIESVGTITGLETEGDNLHLTISSNITEELKIDQSIAHNGVCLTVVKIEDQKYTVTAVQETLERTNLGELAEGQQVNLERCMPMGGRLDGHIVQGHVDTTAVVEKVETRDGSWMVHFAYHADSDKEKAGYVTVEKGSICVNGVSLTVVDSEPGKFSVTIIPYTWEHTNFHKLKEGSQVNLEFDIIGKYVARLTGVSS